MKKYIFSLLIILPLFAYAQIAQDTTWIHYVSGTDASVDTIVTDEGTASGTWAFPTGMAASTYQMNQDGKECYKIYVNNQNLSMTTDTLKASDYTIDFNVQHIGTSAAALERWFSISASVHGLAGGATSKAIGFYYYSTAYSLWPAQTMLIFCNDSTGVYKIRGLSGFQNAVFDNAWHNIKIRLKIDVSPWIIEVYVDNVLLEFDQGWANGYEPAAMDGFYSFGVIGTSDVYEPEFYIANFGIIETDDLPQKKIYVSSGGDDSNTGLHVEFPKQTLDDINDGTMTLYAQDSILVEAGNAFSDSLSIPRDSLYIAPYDSATNTINPGTRAYISHVVLNGHSAITVSNCIGLNGWSWDYSVCSRDSNETVRADSVQAISDSLQTKVNQSGNNLMRIK